VKVSPPAFHPRRILSGGALQRDDERLRAHARCFPALGDSPEIRATSGAIENCSRRMKLPPDFAESRPAVAQASSRPEHAFVDRARYGGLRSIEGLVFDTIAELASTATSPSLRWPRRVSPANFQDFGVPINFRQFS